MGFSSVGIGVRDQKGVFGRLRSTKPVMPNALDGLGLGRARKAGSILQRRGRSIVRIREQSVGYGVPSDMEG